VSPTEAVVYVPAGAVCDDGLFARRGVAHIERRGYRFAGVLRNWKHVLDQAARGVVVVFARREHAATVPGCAVEHEFVGEETCRLVPIVQQAAVQRREQQQGHYGRAAPFDESPTVPILDRWRAAKTGNAPNERAVTPARGREQSAAQLVEDTARLWGYGSNR
jgi:hypothetical protein